MSSRFGTALHSVSLALVVLLYLPPLFFAAWPLYTRVLTPQALLAAGVPVKLAFLALGSFMAFRCVERLDRENPVRPAWVRVAVALVLFLAAQTVLAVYQLVLAIPTPFPSLADPLFVAGMVLWIAGASRFVHVYREVGGAPLRSGPIWLAAAALAALVGFLLYPALEAPAPWMEWSLNLLYPVLDVGLLIPCLFLLRLARSFRGSRLFRVWSLMLMGILAMAAGDILYAYFSALELSALDPLLDLLFAACYILISWGVLEQNRLLAE